MRQAAGKAGGVREKIETGGVPGPTPPFASGRDRRSLIGEVAWIDGFGGADRQALYAAGGAAWETGPWIFSAVCGSRSRSRGGSDDWLLTAGIDHAISEAITAAVGCRDGDEEGAPSRTIGLSLGFASNDEGRTGRERPAIRARAAHRRGGAGGRTSGRADRRRD